MNFDAVGVFGLTFDFFIKNLPQHTVNSQINNFALVCL
jgi:hypothetical protein